MICDLVRHGETDWNLERRYQGQTDVALNATGQAQAKAIAARLRSRTYARVYTSDLRRAAQTAEIIVGDRGFEVVRDPRLREIHLGDVEGLLRKEVAEQHPDYLANWQTNPGATAAPGGETLAQVAARMWAAWQAIMAAHDGTDDRVLLVGHGHASLSLVCQIIGLPVDRFRSFWIDNVGLTQIQTIRGRPVLRRFNDTAHLEPGSGQP